MEKISKIISHFCTFPRIEFVKLFKLTLFNFIIGNEDMHLKNFSLISINNIISCSPAYDLLNTTIAQKNVVEEMALTLNGKKNNFKQQDFFDYYGKKVLMLNDHMIQKVIQEFIDIKPKWEKLINISFLSDNMKKNI